MTKFFSFTPTPTIWNTVYSDLPFEKIVSSELELTSYIDEPKGEFLRPYIEQGLSYFNDALNSNWRSGGLLYYYSFLNLAKGLLVKKYDSKEDINKVLFHHGISGLSPKNEIDSLLDFYCKIQKEPKSDSNINIFRAFYHRLIGEPWPFSEEVKISVKMLLPYFVDLQSEIYQLWKEASRVFLIRGISEFQKNEGHLKILCPLSIQPFISKNLPDWQNSKSTTFSELNPVDQITLLNMFSPVPETVQLDTFMDGPKYTGESFSAARANLNNNSRDSFRGYAFNSISDSFPHSFIFVLPLKINDKPVKWHPLLSSYLFSFIMSDILRYKPGILQVKNSELFFAKQWAEQLPISILREYLLLYRGVLLKRR